MRQKLFCILIMILITLTSTACKASDLSNQDPNDFILKIGDASQPLTYQIKGLELDGVRYGQQTIEFTNANIKLIDFFGDLSHHDSFTLTFNPEILQRPTIKQHGFSYVNPDDPSSVNTVKFTILPLSELSSDDLHHVTEDVSYILSSQVKTIDDQTRGLVQVKNTLYVLTSPLKWTSYSGLDTNIEIDYVIDSEGISQYATMSSTTQDHHKKTLETSFTLIDLNQLTGYSTFTLTKPLNSLTTWGQYMSLLKEKNLITPAKSDFNTTLNTDMLFAGQSFSSRERFQILLGKNYGQIYYFKGDLAHHPFDILKQSGSDNLTDDIYSFKLDEGFLDRRISNQALAKSLHVEGDALATQENISTYIKDHLSYAHTKLGQYDYHTLAKGIDSKKGVCESYASLFTVLMHLNGYKAYFHITDDHVSTGNMHAYNLVVGMPHRSYQFIDLTWADGDGSSEYDDFDVNKHPFKPFESVNLKRLYQELGIEGYDDTTFITP